VKYLIPAGALLVLMVCGLARRQGAETRPLPHNPQPSAQAPVSQDGEPGIPSPSALQAAPDVRATPALPASVVRAPGGASLDVKTPGPDEMLNALQSRLALSEAQCDKAARALRDRAKDLEACQGAYRASGVFVPREYGSTLVRLKEAWYRSIDGILDSEQHLQFDVLVREGFFQPGTEFRADLSKITVAR